MDSPLATIFTVMIFIFTVLVNAQRIALLQWGMGQCFLYHVAGEQSRKLTEAVIGAILILVIIVQMLLDIRMRGGVQFGFTQIIQTLMIFTLICNLVFCVNHQLSWFYYLESLFYDVYYCTLVFYVTYRIVQKSNSSTPFKLRALKITYGFIVFAFFAVFIYSGLSHILQCKQIWFLAIDIFGLIICSIMIQFGYRHHKNETERFMDFKNQNQLNNPLSKMWTLILINLFCQIVQLTQSLVFYFQTNLKCHFSQNQTEDVVLKFLFSFFSLHLSFICTIVIFSLRRKSEQESYSHTESKTNTLELDNNLIQMALTVSATSASYPYSI